MIIDYSASACTGLEPRTEMGIYIYTQQIPLAFNVKPPARPAHTRAISSFSPQFDRTALVLSRGAARVKLFEVLLASLLLILCLACLLLFPLFLAWAPPLGEHRVLLFALFSLLILNSLSV